MRKLRWRKIQEKHAEEAPKSPNLFQRIGPLGTRGISNLDAPEYVHTWMIKEGYVEKSILDEHPVVHFQSFIL